MAKKFNLGIVNIDATTKSVLSNGGGTITKINSDGTTHTTVYSTTDNRHLSFDTDASGNVSNVHTDKNNRAFMDYKGGQ